MDVLRRLIRLIQLNDVLVVKCTQNIDFCNDRGLKSDENEHWLTVGSNEILHESYYFTYDIPLSTG